VTIATAPLMSIRPTGYALRGGLHPARRPNLPGSSRKGPATVRFVLTVEPLPTTLGATIRGVRLASLSEDDWTLIHAAFLEYAVLVFPGQHLSADEQAAFGRRFGPFEPITANEGLTPITNLMKDGSLRDAEDPIMHIIRGNEGWHTDSSYMPVSAKASVLSAHVVPPKGGQTEWADMRAAYDALDTATKDRIAGLSAYHSIIYSQRRSGWDDAPQGAYGYAVKDEPLRPLVKVHPETERPSLFIGRHAHDIPGLDPAESERLLTELLEFACQTPRTYEHQWQVGDVIAWDNRCVLHRARPWDYTEPRLMKHTRIKGDPVTEGVPA